MSEYSQHRAKLLVMSNQQSKFKIYLIYGDKKQRKAANPAKVFVIFCLMNDLNSKPLPVNLLFIDWTVNQLFFFFMDPRSSQYLSLLYHVRSTAQRQETYWKMGFPACLSFALSWKQLIWEAEECNPAPLLWRSPFSVLEKWSFVRRSMRVAHKKVPSLPPLMYTVPQGLRPPGRAVFPRRRTASRGPHHCIHCLICALFIGAAHLYVFCHTLEGFSICSMCCQFAGGKKWTERFSLLFFTHTQPIGCSMGTMSRHCAVADKGPSQTVWEFK